jgi:hypothetical protein
MFCSTKQASEDRSAAQRIILGSAPLHLHNFRGKS